MDEIWTRLETFLRQNAPQIYDGLAPGATEAEIADTEARIGFPYENDCRRFEDGAAGVERGIARLRVPGRSVMPPCSPRRAEQKNA